MKLNSGDREAAARRTPGGGRSEGGGVHRLYARLQRSLRDVHAATQHVGMIPQQYEETGRMILGLQRFQPLLRF